MKKILVAEDDKFLARAYAVKLAQEGFDARIVGDGEEADAALLEYVPDLIILDLVMPKKDGFTVLEEIQNDPRKRKIPVVVVSNLGQKEDIDRAKQLGAMMYVVKSEIGVIELVNMVKQLLQ